ncbi:M23 family metallopeptidase [Streptomyces hainanensis]|uniref:M23 family metallopeptidase n=1 Tax=Streptomyces hainanensis TaxID=402648 RepID=A0A4R4TGN1_9ACTN|nr:M23 family metallopeptidase [Streptomyces hainanensis]TDC73479.1 M23 family metallopeptidase [Streptomyces hainanensis]
MSNTNANRTRKLLGVRPRVAAVVTAAVCGSVALTGVASASEPGNADVFASHTATQLADTTHGQAQAQQTAAADAKTKATVKAKADEAAHAAQAAAKAKSDKSWVSPISDDYTLTGHFGNTGERWASKHSGQDFAVPVGTDVKSVHDGTVVKAGGNGAGDGPAYGNAIVIKHADGTFTQYAHLSKIEVTVGEKVDTGETIALSGNTGNSSGPHLHFEVRTTANYGSAVDPVGFLDEHDVKI